MSKFNNTMEYRKLAHGKENERFSVLGLGTGGLQDAPEAEIELTIRTAIAHGINFFDLCAGGKSVYAPFGRAIADCRENVFFQMHFGAVYNENGEYGWSRKLDEIKSMFEWELKTLNTDYTDMGFLHCVDEDDDFDDIEASGIFDYVRALKSSGVVRHIGFSSHTPSVANRILDTGVIDMMMFSINPAYDFEKGDSLGVGTVLERAELFRRCEKDGVGISVMKPFCAGQLLDEKTSPFNTALTKYQCLQYVLDRPGVLCAVPGVRGISDLNALLGFVDASAAERDYSIIGSFTNETAAGNCVYCNHCMPCPAGIDVGLVNKYYDLTLAGDRLAAGHYDKLGKNASDCLCCGHCDDRCPFGVSQSKRMAEIARYFG